MHMPSHIWREIQTYYPENHPSNLSLYNWQLAMMQYKFCE